MASYAAQREANILKNQELLRSLGLEPERPLPVVKKRPILKKKRTIVAVEKEEGSEDEEQTGRVAKVAKTEETSASRESTPGTRRSSRRTGKPAIDYSDKGMESLALSRNRSSSASLSRKGNALILEKDDGDRPRDRMGQRSQDPKTFGHIPGIPVGTCWELRMHCSTDAVHAPTIAGISGNPKVGAWSIALSGGYEDDVDMGEAFTFTGAGGRDLKGTKANPKNLRTAPQSCDQSFETSLNGALLTSSKTRKPVRVIRGYKGHSKYAPREGYRYDGLYIVEKAWMARGLNKEGYKVCKYALKRVPGQPPIPVRSDEDESGEDKDEEDEDEDESEKATDNEEDE